MRASIVVPTLGRSPLLADCLRALRAEAGDDCELIVVAQGEFEVPGAGEAGQTGPGEQVLRAERPLGFAAAVNRGLAAATAPYVAVINDDAVVEAGWLAATVAALDADPAAASVQGLNLAGEPEGSAPARIDGRGLAWNRWLQAVQLGHGDPVDPPGRGAGAEGVAREVFGVSATAALYRRAALLAVARPAAAGGEAFPDVFDSRLGTYYEDADLALRLRAAGYRALSIESARVRHAGSLTTGDGPAHWRQVHGNRYLVAAGFLGSAFWGRLPRMLLRDLVDLVEVIATGRFRRAAGIVAGWGRALRHLPTFARSGPPRLPASELVSTPAGAV